MSDQNKQAEPEIHLEIAYQAADWSVTLLFKVASQMLVRITAEKLVATLIQKNRKKLLSAADVFQWIKEEYADGGGDKPLLDCGYGPALVFKNLVSGYVREYYRNGGICTADERRSIDEQALNWKQAGQYMTEDRRTPLNKIPGVRVFYGPGLRPYRRSEIMAGGLG